jgi:CRP-like cAMP-binding protein
MITIMLHDFVSHLTTLRYIARTVQAGEMIFERDDTVASVFLVQQGEVHLLRHQEDGNSFVLQRAAAGNILAEASITTQNYHCGAEAVEPSTLSVFSRRDVQTLIAQDPDAARAFVAHLAREVRTSRLRAEIISLRRVSDRLDAWLMWNDAGLPEKGRWHRVANEIGITPEALYRELARRRGKE